MLISEKKIEKFHQMYPYPRFSNREYEKRYKNIRKLMRKKGLDCLLIIGGSAAYGRLWFNLRYVTNMIGKADMCYYCFFPKAGDPCLVMRSGHALSEGMLARTVVREIIVGKPDILTGITKKIEDLGFAKGRIGIVEYDPFTSIPKNHWDFFRDKLPKAEFVFVTTEFLAIRHIKSEEEIQFLEKSAELGDIGIKTLAEKLKPGMTEAQAFAMVYDAVLSSGGEMGMIQLGSASMPNTGINDQRPRPVGRIIGKRDLINNELGIFYNGYEAQTGKPIVTGAPTPIFKEMFEVALEGYKRVSKTLFQGKSSADSIKAISKYIKTTGFELYGSFLQGMGGAQPRHEPAIRIKQTIQDKLIYEDGISYQKGMVFALQMHIVNKQHTKGIFLADTFAVTSKGPKCLNKFPPQLIQI